MGQEQKVIDRLAPTSISRVGFGVRYEPQFGLLNKIGSVVDEVLRAEGTPFGPDVFTHTGTEASEYFLTSTADDKVLRINAQDAILLFPLNSRSLGAVQQLGEQFAEYVLAPLRDICRVKSVVRQGVIVHFDDARTAMKEAPIAHYLGKEFANVNSLQMRVTRRLPALEAIAKKRVEDFRNVIYAVSENEAGKVSIGIDYQEFYLPPLDGREWDERPFSQFTTRGIDYLDGEFQRWFKDGGKAEVA